MAIIVLMATMEEFFKVRSLSKPGDLIKYWKG